MGLWLVFLLPLCLSLHELGHAWIADMSGDPTPRSQGRISLNPLRHMHPVGTAALPLAAFLATGGAFIVAFARPVEIDSTKFRKERIGVALCAAAGPIANLVTGLAAALVLRLLPGPHLLREGVLYFSLLSLGLAVINLLPLPPLDGSRIVWACLGNRLGDPYLKHGLWFSGGLALAWVQGVVFGRVDLLEILLKASAVKLFALAAGL
jgi:Zn-dependent protease